MAAQHQDPLEEKSIEISGGLLGLFLAMHAADLEHDERIGISGEFMQSRHDTHQRLYEFVEEEEPHVDRYRLVKIVEEEESR